MRKPLLFISILQMRERRPKAACNLPKDTQTGNGRAGIWTQAAWLQSTGSSFLLLLLKHDERNTAQLGRVKRSPEWRSEEGGDLGEELSICKGLEVQKGCKHGGPDGFERKYKEWTVESGDLVKVDLCAMLRSLDSILKAMEGLKPWACQRWLGNHTWHEKGIL